VTFALISVNGLSGAGVLHLARPGDTPDTTPMPGSMCGAPVGPLVGIGPVDDLREARTIRTDWALCPRCFPNG